MEIALLNAMVTFQKTEVAVDAIGNHKSGWVDYYSCHATVSGEKGGEKNAAGLTVDDSDLAFTVRYCKKVAAIDAAGFRVVFGDDLYNIVSIDHMNYRKRCLKFRCEKVRR